MKKKVMEDMKPKGVRITQILKKDIDPGLKAAAENIRPPIKIKKEVLKKNTEEIPKQTPVEEQPKITKPAYTETRVQSEKISSNRPRPAHRRGGIPKSLRKIILISMLALGVYWVTYKLQNINITIVEKHQSFTIDHKQFSATNNTSSPIEFQIMIVSDEESKDVTLTDSQNVSIKAQGTITLYNEYSTKAQGLAIHTFVSDSKGKTYQSDKAVTIPGYKLDASKKIIPGQIDVGITAFLPGSTYNGSPADFSINNFKNTDKSKKIYGKLKTPLTGGAQGLVYVVGPQDKGSINATAVSSFKSGLIKKVNAEVPAGYILYPNAMQFSYQTDDNVLSPTQSGKITISGTMTSILFKEKDLKNAVMKNILPSVAVLELDEIDVPDLSNLSLSFVNQGQTIFKDLQSVAFTLSGTLSAIWHPNINKLRASIIGVQKKELTSIFKLDQGIRSATARLFPPWQSHLPTDPSRIHIHLK